ncbi:hypothetical protein EDB86DRAFT_1127416 [Lactarius hatsudake]|nr:hypothetical protein EDB86DRAFT_1127416 [Lactarius hatsudake]
MTPLRGSDSPTTRTQTRLRTCSKQAIWVDNAFLTVKVPCPRHRVSLHIGFFLVYHSTVKIVAAGTGKQHDGDFLHRSWRDDPRRCLVRTPVKQTQHEGRDAPLLLITIGTSRCVLSVRSALSMRIHTPCDRVRPFLLRVLLVPPGALRPRNSVFAYPRPSSNPNGLPDHNLGISLVVPPSNIARRPYPPCSRHICAHVLRQSPRRPLQE